MKRLLLILFCIQSVTFSLGLILHKDFSTSESVICADSFKDCVGRLYLNNQPTTTPVALIGAKKVLFFSITDKDLSKLAKVRFYIESESTQLKEKGVDYTIWSYSVLTYNKDGYIISADLNKEVKNGIPLHLSECQDEFREVEKKDDSIAFYDELDHQNNAQVLDNLVVENQEIEQPNIQVLHNPVENIVVENQQIEQPNIQILDPNNVDNIGLNQLIIPLLNNVVNQVQNIVNEARNNNLLPLDNGGVIIRFLPPIEETKKDAWLVDFGSNFKKDTDLLDGNVELKTGKTKVYRDNQNNQIMVGKMSEKLMKSATLGTDTQGTLLIMLRSGNYELIGISTSASHQNAVTDGKFYANQSKFIRLSPFANELGVMGAKIHFSPKDSELTFWNEGGDEFFCIPHENKSATIEKNEELSLTVTPYNSLVNIKDIIEQFPNGLYSEGGYEDPWSYKPQYDVLEKKIEYVDKNAGTKKIIYPGGKLEIHYEHDGSIEYVDKTGVFKRVYKNGVILLINEDKYNLICPNGMTFERLVGKTFYNKNNNTIKLKKECKIDNKKLILFPNGSVQIIYEDGHTEFARKGGYLTMTYPHGVVRKTVRNSSTKTYFPNGFVLDEDEDSWSYNQEYDKKARGFSSYVYSFLQKKETICSMSVIIEDLENGSKTTFRRRKGSNLIELFENKRSKRLLDKELKDDFLYDGCSKQEQKKRKKNK